MSILALDTFRGTATDLLLIGVPIGVVELGSLWICGAGRVGVCKKRLNRGEDGINGVNGGPLILDYIQTKGAVGVDVGVKHLGGEADSGRLFRILLVEGETKAVNTALPRGLRRAEYGSTPDEKILLTERTGAASLWRLLTH